MMSYDSEALLALRGTVEQRVEHAQLSDCWDDRAVAMLTPYLLFHILDKLESIDETLEAIVKSEAIQGKWDG
jgi:hypothetical protein